MYDEIFYSDLSQQSQHSSQQDDNTPINMATYPRPRGTGGRMPIGDDNQRYFRHPPAPSSPAPPPPTAGLQPHLQNHSHQHRSARPGHRGAGVFHTPHGKPPQSLEKGSKDSGLSSGSSTHQEGGGAQDHTFKGHHRRMGSQGSQGSHPSVAQWVEQCSNERCRIEGNYEVEVSSMGMSA